MTKLIIGNLKMNLSESEIKQYLEQIKDINDDNFIIAPTYIYLSEFTNHKTSAQNCYFENEGAFTGEVSPKQLKSSGVDYVIIGHSERRHILNENDEMISKKLKAALANNLKVIFCIGDTLEEYQNNQTYQVIEKQLQSLKEIDFLENIIIAYEPVWAIGTGKTPTNSEIENTTSYIKKTLNEKDLKVLYGGSVSPDNIEQLNQISNVDGYLVGTASKNALELKEIYWKTR